MVAQITPATCIAKFPSHNAEYVTQVKVEFIHGGNFFVE